MVVILQLNLFVHVFDRPFIVFISFRSRSSSRGFPSVSRRLRFDPLLIVRPVARRSLTHRATIQTAIDQVGCRHTSKGVEVHWERTQTNAAHRHDSIRTANERRSAPCPAHAAHSPHFIVCTLHSLDPAVHSSLPHPASHLREALVAVHHSTRTQPHRCTAIRHRPPSAAHAAAAADSSRLLRPRTQPIHSLATAAATPLLAAATRARALDRLHRQLRPRPAGFRSRLPILHHGRQPVWCRHAG